MPGSQCVVGGCNNKRDGNMSPHVSCRLSYARNLGKSDLFDRDRCWAKWNGPNSLRSRHSQHVCSEHFLLNDFTLTCRLHWQSGLKYKATLNENAVPSLFGERIAIERSKDPVLRAVFRKRECERDCQSPTISALECKAQQDRPWMWKPYKICPRIPGCYTVFCSTTETNAYCFRLSCRETDCPF